jgi:hypothetical protein
MTRVLGYLTALGCTSLVLLLFFWRAGEAERAAALPAKPQVPQLSAGRAERGAGLVGAIIPSGAVPPTPRQRPGAAAAGGRATSDPETVPT